MLVGFLITRCLFAEEVQKYHLSKREVFVYVDIGWRLVYEIEGSVSVNALDASQGLRLDFLNGENQGRDRWAGISSPTLREFSSMLARCAASVANKKAFKEKIGEVELEFEPEKPEVWVKNYGGMMRDSKDALFISVKIPASKIDEFSGAVKKVTEDFESIHSKLRADNKDALDSGVELGVPPSLKSKPNIKDDDLD